jgi:protocatechuate 3,4-dioxygenase, beta subunit
VLTEGDNCLMKIKSIIKISCFFAAVLIFSCGQSPAKEQIIKKEIVTGNCDNPDADINCCFVNMPASVSRVMTIASKMEPGSPLVISGIVYKADGKTPYPNLFIYAYHTDQTGKYTKNGTESGIQKWHGRLHGWCKTDSNGHYEIHTIRPAPYPDNSMPAHIHAAIKTNNGKAFYISDFVFKDDPLVNEKYLSSIKNLLGETGVVELKKSANNTWVGTRNITLKF